MDLTRLPALRRHSELFPRLPLFATPILLALTLTATPALGQKVPFGEQCEPLAPPLGFPSDLIPIQGGIVQLGISEKEVRDIAKHAAHGSADQESSWQRLLVRELGHESVRLPAFLIARHEVTNAQFALFIKATNKKYRFPFDWWKADDQKKHREAYWKKHKGQKGSAFRPLDYWHDNFKDLKWEVPKGKEQFPVAYVSHGVARKYCEWAGMRLPFESEWQYALQGPPQRPTRYIWGPKWAGNDSLKLLQLLKARDRKKKAVGSVPGVRSWCGADDMLGNVWEWLNVGSSFAPFAGYRSEKKTLDKRRHKMKLRDLPEVLWEARPIVRGGSYVNAGQAEVVFRSNTRMPKSDGQTIEDLGFRVAKSFEPAFDGSVLRGRSFDPSSIQGLSLDLPTGRDLRDRSARAKRYELRGIERWVLDGELIRGYHLVSFVPVRTLKFKSERELTKKSSGPALDGAHGVPIAAVFTTEPFEIQQGLNRYVSLNADLYAVSYRAAGIPRDLDIAMRFGAQELKRNKGVRSSAMPKDPKKKDPKKGKKKHKKSKKGKRKANDKASGQKRPWTEVVDHYGIPDEVTAKYPKVKPTEITINPGALKIPINKAVLIFRRHDGGYLAWAEYQRRVTRSRVTEPELQVDTDKNWLTYSGGPRTTVDSYRFAFRIAIRLAQGELQKNWITPGANDDVVKALNKRKITDSLRAKPDQKK